MTQRGDNININARDISNTGGQQTVGKAENVRANIAPQQDQGELLRALQTLKEAVLASAELSNEERQEHVAVITQVSEEAVKPKPNKALLKMLGGGLLTALGVIPDVTSAVNGVIPLLNNLHL